VAAPLNPVERALQRAAAELGEATVPCALVGGLAVSARAEPRTTRDVDLAVSVLGDEQAEQLIFHLQDRQPGVRPYRLRFRTRTGMTPGGWCAARTEAD
jgi:hypothetical protein